MKRILIATGAALFGILAVTLGTAFAQGGVPSGFPPETDLFNDAVLLARIVPLVAALGIGFGVWQARRSLRQPKSAPNSPTVIRHDFGTVVAHWTNAIGFITGIITGLIILRWLPRPDAMRGVFALHYVGASLAVFGIASHLTQNSVTGGMGLIPRSLQDLRNGVAEIGEYLGFFGPDGAVFGIKLPKFIRDTFGETLVIFGLKPTKKIGKFLPIEKVLSYTPWSIIIGVIVVTGLIKSFRYLYPIPPTFIASVSLLHDIFAYAAVVMLVIHLAAVLLVPRNWPLLVSMFTTRVSRRHVQLWHPVWFKELTAKEQAVSAVPQVPHSPDVEQATAPSTAE